MARGFMQIPRHATQDDKERQVRCTANGGTLSAPKVDEGAKGDNSVTLA
jgi:hypothetical protein